MTTFSLPHFLRPHSSRRQQAGSAECIMPFARRRHVPFSFLVPLTQLRLRLSARVLNKRWEFEARRRVSLRTSAPVHGRSNFAGSFVRREALRRKGACSFSTTARAERYLRLRTPPAKPAIRSASRGSGCFDPPMPAPLRLRILSIHSVCPAAADTAVQSCVLFTFSPSFFSQTSAFFIFSFLHLLIAFMSPSYQKKHRPSRCFFR